VVVIRYRTALVASVAAGTRVWVDQCEIAVPGAAMPRADRDSVVTI
jgi:hypothetical protein